MGTHQKRHHPPTPTRQGFTARRVPQPVNPGLIISEKSREIADILTEKYQLGVTKLHGRGGYQGSEKMVLFSVVRREDISSLKRVALKKDPNAFITVIASEDVTGLQVGNQPHW